MAEVHLRVDDEFVHAINERLEAIHRRAESPAHKVLTATEITREALAVYRWVVERTANNTAVVAANENKELVSQLETRHIPARAPTGFQPESAPAKPLNPEAM